ncbi:MAG: hypothetical protein AAF752_08125 [Bacteroidota bacterium]
MRSREASLRAYLKYVFFPVVGTLGAVAAWSKTTNVPASDLMRDAVAVLDGPFYVGALSTLSVSLWVVGAVASFVAYLVLKERLADHPGVSFFRWSALFSLVLAADDAFLLHEVVGPDYLSVSSLAFYGGYGVFLAILLGTQYRFILDGHYLILAVGLLFFGLSLAIDIAYDVFSLSFYAGGFWEDGCKLIGLSAWASYFVFEAVRCLSRPVWTDAPELVPRA